MKTRYFSWLKRLKLVFCLILIFTFSLNINSQSKKCFRIGVHADMNMFLNLFKNAFWIGATPPLDTNGYPLSIPNGNISSIEAGLSFFQSTIWNDSVYVIRWDGDGDAAITTYGAVTPTIIASTNGRIEFKVHYNQAWSATDQFQVKLNITRSNAANRMRNIRLYLKTYENAYETGGQIFHPLYLKNVQPFYAFRFMTIFNINGSTFKTWADRTTPTYYNQSAGQKGSGLAYEWACALCNTTKKHMYFNVPHAADNDAIKKMAGLVYKNLSSDLDVYLEYSNETWNQAGSYAVAASWIANYANSYCGGNWSQANAILSNNVFRIWRQVFGKDSLRIKRVMSGHPYGCLQPCGDGVAERLKYMQMTDFDVIAGAYYWSDIKTNWCNTTTAINDIAASIRSTASGSWYQYMKADCDYAKQLGKEFYCYEGGYGSDPQLHTNFSCWNVVRQVQTDPRLRPLVKEVFDSLTNIGVDGGNELVLINNWLPIGVSGGTVGFWGNIPRIDAMVDTCPKQQGIIDYVSTHNCENMIKASDTIGSGMAIRLDGVNDYIDASLAYKPNDITDNYTIETWIRPEYIGTIQYIWSLASGLNPAGNVMFIGNDNRIHWQVKNNSGSIVASLTGSLSELNKYCHIMAVKSGSTYKLYINGSEKASAAGNLIGDCNHSRLILGANIINGITSGFFRGRIDEFRIWNTAITNLSTIRDWMCRITKVSHPNFANLRAYYRFDIVDLTGKVKDQFAAFDAQLYNVGFSKYSNYTSSGAPVGDNSVQIYPSGWSNSSLTYYHSNGDRFTVTGLGAGNPEGVHIYMVGQKPTNATTPSSQYLKIGRYYYGVFTANGTPGSMPGYDVIYYYTGNPDASSNDGYNRILKRSDNNDVNGWQNTGAILNAQAKTLTTRYKREFFMGEYIIGQRLSQATNKPGPGYAIKFNATPGAKAEININRPERYTVSFWYKASSGLGGIMVSFLNTTSCVKTEIGNFSIRLGSATCMSEANGTRSTRDEWHNATFVRNSDDIIYGYLDGVLWGSVTAYPNGQKGDYGITKLIIGSSNYSGLIDEFQLWDTALDLQTIREWMCRKITRDHPLENKHLLLYYQFDEGAGNSLENTRGSGELNLTNVSFSQSGAPIGDTSVCVYPASSSDAINLSITHPDGDNLSFSKAARGSGGGYMAGVQLYRTDGKAQFSKIPGSVLSIDTTRYWGIYPVTSSSEWFADNYSYTAKYDCQKNKNINDEPNTRLLDRKNSADSLWNLLNAAPVAHIFSRTYSMSSGNGAPREFMLGGITAAAITIDTTKPAQPSIISGPNNVCSGATGLTYSITKIVGMQYVWTLPAGMSGYSDSNKITVSVSPSANGNLGNISVYAVNRNGSGLARSLAITAQNVPSLSVDINGPVEVCSGQTATYSIPAVSGASSYSWSVTPDGTIIANNNTSVNVKFGQLSGPVSVIGVFGCGSSLINNKAITVNIAPSTGLVVSGGRICREGNTTGDIIIRSSEIGVTYQAYKNGGTSPVGNPAIGTGSDLSVPLPLSDLFAGDNIITIKAKQGNCVEATLTNTAIFTVDVSPDPQMPVLYNSTVCASDTAIISFPNALSGMKIMPAIKSYWRVDDPAVKYYPPSGIALPDSKQLKISPSQYNQQLSTNGINKGRNDITFSVVNGVCPAVQLATSVVINVPNNPHSIDFQQYAYWYGSFAPTYPWVPAPNLADSIRVTTSRPGSQICQSDSIIYTIHNAQAGVSYYARINYNTDLALSYHGPAVSKIINCTTDHSTITLTVPSYSMPITPRDYYNDYDDIQIIAEGFGCKPILAIYKYHVLPGIDTTKMVIGSTVCQGDNGTITIRNSQEGLTYKAYFHNPITPIATTTGNGGDAVLTIPKDSIPSIGTYSFIVTVGSSTCLYSAFPRKSIISVINTLIVNNPVKLAFDADTTCMGLDDSIWVINSLAGVSYRAYVNGSSVGTATIGTGYDLSITLPWSDLAAYANTTVTVSIKATVGSCATNVPLTNTKQLYINGSVDLTNERIIINKNPHWSGTYIVCPEEAYNIALPVQIQNVPSVTYPVYYKAGFTNAALEHDTIFNSVTASQANSGSWANLGFNSTIMQRQSIHYFQIFVKEKGCPLHKAKSISSADGGSVGLRKITVYPDYLNNPLILPDTVCYGNMGSLRIQTQLPKSSTMYADYRLYDSVTTKTISSQTTNWGTRDANDNLYLPINTVINPGINKFKVEIRFWGCGWHVLNPLATLVVNTPPDQSLTMEGNSVCNGNGTVIISNTQNNVSYLPVIGAMGVSPQQYGNGSDITFTIDKKYLTPGINQVSFSAAIRGCTSVTLTDRAIIQIVSSAPAKPTTPVGPATICPNDSNLIYNVVLDPDAMNYKWDLPSGASTISTSNIASVSFGAVAGAVRVSSSNVCGNSPLSDPVFVDLYPTAQGGNIYGPSIGCPGEKITLALQNYLGDVVKWQYSTSIGIWNDIFVFDSIYTTFPITDTTLFRAEIKSGTCDSVYSLEHKINISEGEGGTDYPPLSISGLQSVTCLQANQNYQTNISGKPLSWSLSSSEIGEIISTDSSGTVSINWQRNGYDTVKLIVTYPELGCSRIGLLPVNINELVLSYRRCLPSIELSGNSIIDTTYDAMPNINCNIFRIYNDYNNQSSLQGETIKESEVTVTWHLVSISGKDSICVSLLTTEPNNIPSAFSPNGDGRNDTWFVPGLDVASDDFTVQVFNRWGNLVYDHSLTHAPWEGRDPKGISQPVGSYHYYINFKNGKKPQMGIVTILR